MVLLADQNALIVDQLKTYGEVAVGLDGHALERCKF